MGFPLKKETRRLREEVFELLPHSRQETRTNLLRVRDILWTIDNALIFGEKDRTQLMTLFGEALELVFLSYDLKDYEQQNMKKK